MPRAGCQTKLARDKVNGSSENSTGTTSKSRGETQGKMHLGQDGQKVKCRAVQSGKEAIPKMNCILRCKGNGWDLPKEGERDLTYRHSISFIPSNTFQHFGFGPTGN